MTENRLPDCILTLMATQHAKPCSQLDVFNLQAVETEVLRVVGLAPSPGEAPELQL